jgi:ethanolamine permease
VKFAPAFLGKIHPRFKTPFNALWSNTIIGIAALLTGKTAEIITIAVFGALTLYIISMISLIQLRKNEPELNRPFRVPAYPFFPIVALFISVVSFISMTVFYPALAAVYFIILGVCFLTFKYHQRAYRN